MIDKESHGWLLDDGIPTSTAQIYHILVQFKSYETLENLRKTLENLRKTLENLRKTKKSFEK